MLPRRQKPRATKDIRPEKPIVRGTRERHATQSGLSAFFFLIFAVTGEASDTISTNSGIQQEESHNAFKE